MKALAIRSIGIFMLLAWAVFPQEPPGLSDEQILSRCLGEMKNTQVFQSLDGYSFTKHVSMDQLNMRSGKSLFKDDRVYEFTPRPDGKTDVRLVAVKGAPPTPKQLKQHEKEMHKELSKSDEQREMEKKKAEDENTFLSEDFLLLYDFKLAGREAWNGVPAFRIELTPKSEKAPLKVKSDKLLRHTAGSMWMNQASFRVLATEMHTVESIKVWGGFAGAINNLVTRTEYSADASGPYLPKLNTAEVEMRVLLAKMKIVSTEEYSNFHKLDAKPPAATTPP